MNFAHAARMDERMQQQQDNSFSCKSQLHCGESASVVNDNQSIKQNEFSLCGKFSCDLNGLSIRKAEVNK